jgi:hypothetical protein
MWFSERKYTAFMTDEIQDLPDKNPLELTSVYSLKIHPSYKKKIDVINAYKDGLTSEIRRAVEAVVDMRWEKLQAQLKNDQAG